MRILEILQLCVNYLLSIRNMYYYINKPKNLKKLHKTYF